MMYSLLSVFSLPVHAAGGLTRIFITFNTTIALDIDVNSSLKASDTDNGYRFDTGSTYYEMYDSNSGETVNGVVPASITMDGVSVQSNSIVKDAQYPYTTEYRLIEGKTASDGVIKLHVTITDPAWEYSRDYVPVYMLVRYYEGENVKQATYFYSETLHRSDNSQIIKDDIKSYQPENGQNLAWFGASTVSINEDKAEYIITIDLNGPVQSQNSQSETHTAETIPGENSGTDIRPEIVESSPVVKKALVSIGGALLTAGAISASSDKSTDSEEEKKKKTYRMKVYKNFGDGIRRGADPERVFARIVEIKDGQEINRPDLSEKITASGFGMNVQSVGIINTYMAADVSVPADSSVEKATLTFTFTGEGGAFRNNIVFRVVGEPEIIFPGLSADGKEWILDTSFEPVKLIAGAEGTEKVLFLFEDAYEEPKDITFLVENGFDITKEKYPNSQYAYYAVIQNNSAPAEKQNGIFGEKRNIPVTIIAEFSGGLKVEKGFYFELYPEGFTVLYSRGQANDIVSRQPGNRPAKLQDGRLEVISYACYEGFSQDIPHTNADICYAWRDTSGKARIVTDGRYFSCGELRHTDDITQNILAKYRCYTDIAYGMLTIRPKDSLPEHGDPLYVMLPVSINTGEWTDRAEIPLRLLGEKIDLPTKEWQTEYDLLRAAVKRHIPEEFVEERLRSVEEIFGEPGKYDHSELRIIRKELIHDAVEYWYRQKDYYKSYEKDYNFADNYRKPFRYIGDFAFSIVARFYWGDNEAWISPCKDLIVDCVDEALWSYYFTKKIDVSVTDKIMEQSTNALENAISVSDSTTFKISQREAKKLFFCLIAYITVDWTKTYYNMDPKDFWESWRSTWMDLSTLALKKLAGMGLSKAMAKSETIQKFFDSQLMQELNNAFQGQARGKFKPMFLAQDARQFAKTGNVDISAIREGVWTATNSKGVQVSAELSEMVYVGYREVLQKILDSLLGLGVSKVMGSAKDAVKDSAEYGVLWFPVKAGWFDMEGEDAMVSVDIIKLFTSAEGLSSIIYDTFFNMLFGPVAPMIKSLIMPEDPGKVILDDKK